MYDRITHKDVFDFLIFQKIKGNVNTKGIDKLNDHRSTVADLFGLIDKDNDVTLYKDLDKLMEFWSVVDDEIEKIDN